MTKRKNILEPSPKNTDEKSYESEIYVSFVTYQGISSSKEHKKWILEYILLQNKDTSKYSHAKPKEYSPHGIWARFLCRNIKIPEKNKLELDVFLSSLEVGYEQSQKAKEVVSVERKKKYIAVVRGYLTDINMFMDLASSLILSKKKKEINVTKFCDQMNISAPLIPEIIEYLNQSTVELILAKDKKDEQLVEGYAFFTPSQLQSYIDVHNEVAQFYSSKIDSIKNNRKPRKKKQKTPEQIATKVQFQEFDAISGIKSIHPSLVVGCNSVYVFNTKTKAIIWYKSKNGDGFSFKGSNILNIDSEVSYGKKIRGYDKYLQNKTFQFPTHKHAQQIFSSLNTKRFIPNVRFNKNTVILSIQR